MTTNVLESRRQPAAPAVWIGLLVVALVGVGVAWGLQIAQGMQVTGLGQQVVWGLYIAGFFTAAGAGAGQVFLAVAGEFWPQFSVVRRRSALLLGLVCFAVGAVLITMDLGSPLNLWRILTAGRFSSMMTWDFWALLVTGGLVLAYLVVSWKQAGPAPAIRGLGVLAAIGAAGLVLVESWMLSAQAARPLWGGGLVLVSFVVAAGMSGLAVGVLAWKEHANRLKGWLAAGLGVSLALVLAEVLTGVVSRDPRTGAEMRLLLSGTISPLFWLHLVVGLVLPLAMLIWGKSSGWLQGAAILAVVGVVMEKLWLLAAGQALPWLALPGGSYLPSWSEIAGVLGAAALGALLFLALKRWTRLNEA